MKKEEINKMMEEFFSSKVDHFTYTEKRINDIENFLEEFNLKNYSNVLDVACGTGVISSYLAKFNNKVTAIDMSSKMIEVAKTIHFENNITFLNEDFYNFKGDELFDLIVIFNAYPHFLDKNLFVESLIRLLSKNGRAVILHDASKDVINVCHSNISHYISVKLKPVEEESIAFLQDFNIKRVIDNNNSYMIDLIKK